MPIRERRGEELLSLATCTACAHPESGHDHLGCFLRPQGTMREEYSGVLETRQLLKETGAECWCRQYETDLAKGIDSLLKYGDGVSLVVATNAAVERGDTFSAERLLDGYVRKVHEHRDPEWVRAIERSIGRLQSQPNPAGNDSSPSSQSLSVDADSQPPSGDAAEEKKRSDSQPIRPMSKAPAPIIPVRGSWRPHAPKPTQAPLEWPLNYPNHLKPQTEVIIGEALRKFPVQTQTLRLCKCVISDLTPHFCEAVQEEALRPHVVLSATADLVHYLVVANCDDTAAQFRLEVGIKQSDEWLNLAKGMARESSATKERQLPNPKQTQIGANIDRLRKECGWSFNKLAERTGLEKKLILGHVNHGKGIWPATLRIYADAFTKKLERPVTVAELEILP